MTSRQFHVSPGPRKSCPCPLQLNQSLLDNRLLWHIHAARDGKARLTVITTLYGLDACCCAAATPAAAASRLCGRMLPVWLLLLRLWLLLHLTDAGASEPAVPELALGSVLVMVGKEVHRLLGGSGMCNRDSAAGPDCKGTWAAGCARG